MPDEFDKMPAEVLRHIARGAKQDMRDVYATMGMLMHAVGVPTGAPDESPSALRTRVRDHLTKRAGGEQ